MAIKIEFAEKYVHFGPDAGLHTQGEARAETYDITGPRYYDGRDLSELTWYARASHPNYRLTWPLDADYLAYAGPLQLEFVGKTATGEEIIKLQSNGLKIKASVEGTASPPQNLFEAAVAQMEVLASNAANAAAQSKLDADRAEDAQEAAAQDAQAAEKAKQDVDSLVDEAGTLAAQIEAAATKTAQNAAAAKESEDNAASSASAAAGSATAAKGSEDAAASSATAAAGSATAAKGSEDAAASSATAAAGSAGNAEAAKTSAESAAKRAEDAAATVDMTNYLQKTGDGSDVTVTFTASDAPDFSAPTSGSKLSAIMTLLSKWRNYIARALTPTGAVLAYAGATIPAGFLLCDGRAVSRTTYAALFGVIGTTYGSGDGTTTFNLPDLRGRVPVGVDSDTNLGRQSGATSQYFSWDNLPTTPALATWQDSYKAVIAEADAPNLYGVNNKWGGAGTPLSNVQPSLNLNQIIKV